MTIAPFALPSDLAGLQMALLTASAVALLALLWVAKSIGRALGAVLLVAFIGNVVLVFSGNPAPLADELAIESSAES